MNPVSSETLLAQLKWRYAVKKFDPARKVSPEHWNTIAEALALSASSYGLQPWKFLAITNPDIKAKLPAISWSQTQPQDASHMVVLCVRKKMTPPDVDHFVARIAEVRGQTVESLDGYRKMMMGVTKDSFDSKSWAANQVYIALGTLLTSAAMLGIDACPMEGIDTAKYDELLGLTSTPFTSVVGCALGYRAEDDKYAAAAKVRFPVSEVVQVI